MKNTTLKLCPFCGNKPERFEHHNFGYGVRCFKCYSRTDYYSSKSAATKAWNRRTDDRK